jgi:hypothetical protein
MSGNLDLANNNLLNLGYIDATEITPPASPASTKLRLYVEDVKGFSFFSFVDDTGMVRKIVRDSVFVGKNITGSAIAIGTPVYASGSSGNVPTLAVADSDNLATMPSIGITAEEIANNAFGRVMQVGLLENFDTNAFTEGDILFVASGGGLTTTAPLWPNLRQEVGTVLVKSVGAGAIQCIARSMTNEGTLDHGGLLGLADDDHPQYAAIAQNESVSGDWTITAAADWLLSGTIKAVTGAFILDNEFGGSIRFLENSAGGTNYIGLQAPAAIAATINFTVPAADGSANDALITNGAAGLSFGAANAVSHNLLDGSVHGDSVADTVTRGSLIYGNSTPHWSGGYVSK